MFKTALVAISLIMISCGNDSKPTPPLEKHVKPVRQNYRNAEGKKEGRYTSKSETGVIQTDISYRNGLRHGESLEYYDSGKLRARVNYVDGKKHGKAYWYFDGEQAFRINTYDKDIRSGLQEKFYRNGNKLSVLEFKNEYPGVGLREWKENGDERHLGNTIKASKKGNAMSIEMASGKSNVQFYYGKLDEGKFLNPSLIELAGMNGTVRLNKKNIKDLNDIVITARYKTYLKNDRIVSQTFKWSEL